MKLLAKLEKSKDVWFLLFTSFFFFILRLPSLFEPYWYGDEGIYETIGSALRNGRMLYSGIWDNKPPLLYVLYAIFDGDQFSVRLLSLIFGILSVIVFFFLLKLLFRKNDNHLQLTTRPIYWATGIFAFLFAIPLLEGNIANAENFMLLLVITAGFCVVRFLDTKKSKTLWYAGFLLAFAALFKIVGIFDMAAFGIFLLITQYKNTKYLVTEIKTLLPFGIAFFIPFVFTFLYFFFGKALNEFISASFQQNVGYVGYGNTFIIPQGLLYLKLVLLIIFVCFVFLKRQKIATGSLFIYLWLSFSLFNAFFSGRPYTHYLLVLLPSFCLFLGIFWESFSEKLVASKPIYLQLRYLYTASFVIITLLVLFNFHLYDKTISYYQNFFAFMTSQKDLASYQAFFDGNTPTDYALAQFLKTHNHKNNTVFVWGDSAQIYTLSKTLPPGKYTVAYHILGAKNAVAETAKAIATKKPRFIVLMSSQNFPFDLSHYRYAFSIQNRVIYESIR